MQTIVKCVFLCFFPSPLSHFLYPCILTWVEFVVGCLPYSKKIFLGCSSSSQNVVEEELVGMLPQKSYLFYICIFIFFIEHPALIYKILGYRAVSLKTQIFLVEILRRESFLGKLKSARI